MRTGRFSLWSSAILLCVPTLVTVLLGIYFFVTDIPEMRSEEESQFVDRMRRFSIELDEEPELSDFVWQRRRGIVQGDKFWESDFPAGYTWKDWDPVGGTKKKDMWGWRDTSRGRLVWKRSSQADASLVYGALTDIERSDRSTVILVFGSFALLVLVFATVVGLKYLVDYVKSRDDFMAAAAHDLTTPLVAMRYMIGRNDAEASTLCERLLRLVSNIKDFMRLGGKRAEPGMVKFDLIKAYEEAYSLFREDYRDIFNGEDVVLTRGEGVPPEGPVFVRGDETLVVQILWNLLGNDLKYAAPYGKVEVCVSSAGEAVDVSFIDEGQGMSRKEMRKAFNRYYRAKTVLVSGKGGFGLGLSTAREFAEMMGGRLKVASNSPKGCVFTLSLPK